MKSPELTSALDRIKLTSAKLRWLLAPIARVFQAYSCKTRLSTNTIERTRKKNRKIIITQNIKDDFFPKFSSEASIIHFDGKLLTDMNRNIEHVKRKVDRIAVAVTSNGKSNVPRDAYGMENLFL